MLQGPVTVDVSVVSPVYGCAGCIEALVERIDVVLAESGLRHEIVLVDDASPDQAWQRIREVADRNSRVKGVRLSRNFGQHAAISAGLAEAQGRIVVVMDCDLQDRPEEIPALLSALGPDCQVALAQRQERSDTAAKRFGSWSFYKLLGWLTGTTYDHSTANFGAYARPVVDAYNMMPESERFFPLLIRWTGFRVTKVPVQHDLRGVGETSYSFKKLLRLAFHIALSFSEKPLRAVVFASMVFAVISFVLAGLAIVRYAAGDIQVAGFTSIIASIWLVGSAMLGSIGVVGLYVGRIFSGVKARPNFIIAERHGGDHGGL